MPAAARQLGAELRKLVHPVTAIVVVAAGVVASALQIESAATAYPPPSSIDLAGSLWVAADQLSSTLGFLVGGTLAAVATAAEVESRTIETVLLHEPRRLRLALVKITACTLALAASLVLVAGILRGSALAASSLGVEWDQTSAATWAGAWPHVARFLLVAVFIAALATTLALATRSELATVAVTTCAFVVPLLLLRAEILRALFPTWWIINWMHYDPFGHSVDFLASNSQVDRPSILAGVVLLAASAGLLVLSRRLLTRIVEL